MNGMKRIAGLIIIFVLLVISHHALAAIPQIINYQGFLKNTDGTPVNAAVSVVFSIYGAASGGSALWNETRSVTPANGVYSVQLGSGTAFPADLFTHDLLYLGVKVGSDPEMSPRQQLTTTPYAIRAGTADSVTAANITGTLPVTIGGTGGTTAASARTNLVAAASGANSDIHSITGLTTPLSVAQGGTGSAVKNFADLTTNQTIGGTKTFSSTINGSITGNSATVSNGVYTTGSYANPYWITSLAGSKISGGDFWLSDEDVYFRSSTDTNHGIGFYGAGKTFNNVDVDGPVLYGNSGGALGTSTYGSQKIALTWDNGGNVGTSGNMSVSGQIESKSGGFKFPDGKVQSTAGLIDTGAYGDPSWITSLSGSKITGKVASATNADTVTNGLYSTVYYGDPSWLTSLSGNKITGKVASATNADTVTNGLYSTVYYADPSWLTSLSGNKITGKVASATNADAVTKGVYTNGAYADPIWITSLAGSKIFGGNFYLNTQDFYLKNNGDTGHGLGWYGTGKKFAGATPDGPVLYGGSGGALGTMAGAQHIALTWNTSGNVSATGQVESQSGGFKFPDGTVQTTAAAPPWNKIITTNRFEDALDGSATLDKETGLVWTKQAGLAMILWTDAMDYCQDYDFCGRKGWRLPTVEELSSLVDPDRSGSSKLPAVNPFYNTNAIFWTSSTCASDSSKAWAINMSDGSVTCWAKDTLGLEIWPVRGGSGH
jgi:hypothetical protein